MSLAIDGAVRSSNHSCNDVVNILKSRTSQQSYETVPGGKQDPATQAADNITSVRLAGEVGLPPEAVEDEKTGLAQCLQNFKVDGGVLIGKRFSSSQDFPNLSRARAYDKVLKYIVKTGSFNIRTSVRSSARDYRGISAE
ncbi:MAG: hypothetical protein HY847_08930 [Betaproteobacteria bacterium]|nr:hypothetical protein [Betaproteobacteria bacterium]